MEYLAGYHCGKCPSPTFTNICSHCPWVLKRADMVFVIFVARFEQLSCLRDILLSFLLASRSFEIFFITRTVRRAVLCQGDLYIQIQLNSDKLNFKGLGR